MNNLLLHDSAALADFFTDTVFVISENEKAIPEFKYIGSYQKNILILVNDSLNEVGTIEGKDLLKNILKHLNIGNRDFGILNICSFQSLSFSTLKKALNPALVIAFGITEQNLIFNPPLSSNYEKYEGIEIFKGDFLNDMAHNVEMKKSFLKTLQNFKN